MNQLDALIKKEYSNTVGLIVWQNGETLYENYFNNCSKDSRVQVFSVTKSIFSLLLGIAADRGLFTDVNQKVLDFFPDYPIKRGNKVTEQITIEHLLTMTAPFQYKNPPYARFFQSSDWVRASLNLLGGSDSLGKFVYRPLIGPDLLSGILTRITGETVLAFAQKNLFEPLHIQVDKSVIFHNVEEQLAYNEKKETEGWVADPNGVNTAAWGLSLTTPELLRIGQLVLQKGNYGGQQIVSQEWIQKMTTTHSHYDLMNLNYGYLWWILEDCAVFCAMGDGGNILYIDHTHNMVIAGTGYFKPRVKDRVDLIKHHILPMLLSQ